MTKFEQAGGISDSDDISGAEIHQTSDNVPIQCNSTNLYTNSDSSTENTITSTLLNKNTVEMDFGK